MSYGYLEAAYRRSVEREIAVAHADWESIVGAVWCADLLLDEAIAGLNRAREDLRAAEGRGDVEAMAERCRREEYGPLSDWVLDHVTCEILADPTNESGAASRES